uniref:Geminin n=2 Tax=Octopus bimaculoides TaxID=37653 RepID=A0A0L8HYC3_OCTBM|eukprot:XP_014768380.1 PREDICTED: geminin-like [Octopus bimaculoides]
MGKKCQLSNKRDSLQELQPCATVGSTHLVGKSGLIPTKSGKSKLVDSTQRTLVLQDSKLNLNSPKPEGKATETERRLVQTSNIESAEKEANELMCETNIPETYWKDYSEQQRQALAETLEENKALHEENKQLKSKVEELTFENDMLKHENETLSELASKAEDFANLVQSAIGESENTEDKEGSADATSTEESQSL